jgi:hydroxymethylpyrimidine/phosphomethylpyrimidine kinase
MKTALTIGGSDSSGGAGIQADLKTFSVLGVFGMSAITAVTAQNTLGVQDVMEVSPEIVRKQIDATAGDIQADALKTGMLVNSAIVDVVEESIKRNKLAPYVCDPVMVSKSGATLLQPDAKDELVRRLFPLATIVTPNRHEAAALGNLNEQTLTNVATVKDAAKRIADLGAKTVVIKGIAAADQMIDVFFDGKEFYELAGKIQPAEKSHGSGCAFSAAITAGLASGMNLLAAIDQAKQLVNMAIQYSDGQGRGTAPINVLAFAPKKKK